jgi:hypothetical protein
VRRVVLFVALYLVLAVVLGLAFSWGWAAVVIFFGLIPAGAVWFAFRQMEDSHLDWDQAERDRHSRH